MAARRRTTEGRRFRKIGPVAVWAVLAAGLIGFDPRPAPAGMEDYCQYPPYVFQSVLPSVNLLVSNSSSMLNFAYYDNTLLGDNYCDNVATPCSMFDPSQVYYGYFNPDYYYSYSGNKFQRYASPKSSSSKANTDWDGNFLNWLAMRRIDVLRKVLTGGTMESQAASAVANGIYKFYDDNRTYTPFNGPKTFTFNVAASNQSEFTVPNPGGGTWRVQVNETAPTGVLQEIVGPKARVALTFFNFDDQGGGINPEIGTANPLSSLVNRINGPSNIKGGDAAAPLAEALWTIVGDFAQVGALSVTGPLYHNGDYNTTTNLKDPYYYNGHFSRCLKGAVVVISDGEPCADGSVPPALLDFADNTAFNCQGTNCIASPPLFPSDTAVVGCPAGGAVAGVEDVSLFAHTTDLRSATFGKSAVSGSQKLDLYFVRAFGRGSTLLKYAALNGSFDDVNGNGRPDPGEYNLSEGYYEATSGQDLQKALTDLFSKLIRRATSGTAASVLASGEGSGANLLQAVFYPRRRFGNDILEWTGTLQNLWYFVDPRFSNASIREDSCTGVNCTGDRILNLTTDKTAVFVFDPATDTTKVNLYGDSNGDGIADGSPTAVSLEDLKNIWEAGNLLHQRDADTRTIFTLDNSTTPPSKLPLTTANASTLQTALQASSSTEAAAIISYVRGKDDVDNDNVIDFRNRTVVIGTDNTVWKMGDIINSTPRIAASFPLNSYDRIYNDNTYSVFTQGSTYRNRGMVFAGGNDGIFHAFKLGKLEFSWAGQTTFQKGRLTNIDNVVLGYEKWGFVPKNSLPYLRYLLDNNYCHLYYSDLSPYIFDASIGGSSNSPSTLRDQNQWRTVLIGGMRYGGACRDFGASCTDCVKSPVSGLGLSSYFALEVTNPDNPSLLWEFSNSQLGFTTTGPAIIRIHGLNTSSGTPVPDRSLDGYWYAVFASGPTGPINTRQFLGRSDQNLRIFVVNLKSGVLERVIDTGIPEAFGGSMFNSTADFDLDYQDDAVYIPYVRKNSSTGAWTQGGVGRLFTNEDPDPNNWEFRKVIDGIGPVSSAVARLQNNIFHSNWLFFGTGRYFYELPSNPDDPSTQRNLYGIKDPCFGPISNTIDPSCITEVNPADLTNVDSTTVSDLVANGSGFHGWSINLDTVVSIDYDGAGSRDYRAERVITDPLATTSGLVFFTTYRPYGDDCALGGKSFLWATRYNTGGAPTAAMLKGKALVQVSTASIEQLDLSTAFQGDATLHRGGRRSFAMEGVPPTAQGLSLLSPPPPVKRLLHIRER